MRGIKAIIYHNQAYNWGFGDLIGDVAAPLWKASEVVAKPVLGAINKIPSRGYNAAQNDQQKVYDLYNNNNTTNLNTLNDPSLRAYQKQALDRLSGISSSPNLDATSQAQLNQINQQEGQRERGARGAIMQNAYARGAGSSTGNLLSQLTNEQSGAQNTTNQDLGVAAQQQKRALDALQASTNLASNINTQDMNRARALDQFNEYNLTGKAGALTNEGNLSIGKAGAQNAFWGNLIGAGASLANGSPSGAGAQAGGSQSPYYAEMPAPGQSAGPWMY